MNDNAGRLEKLTKKIRKDYAGFEETVVGLSQSELEVVLLRYAKEAVNVQNAKENDEQLNQTQELLKELKGPYSDAQKAIKLKSHFLLALLEEKGGNVEGQQSA